MFGFDQEVSKQIEAAQKAAGYIYSEKSFDDFINFLKAKGLDPKVESAKIPRIVRRPGVLWGEVQKEYLLDYKQIRIGNTMFPGFERAFFHFSAKMDGGRMKIFLSEIKTHVPVKRHTLKTWAENDWGSVPADVVSVIAEACFPTIWLELPEMMRLPIPDWVDAYEEGVYSHTGYKSSKTAQAIRFANELLELAGEKKQIWRSCGCTEGWQPLGEVASGCQCGDCANYKISATKPE